MAASQAAEKKEKEGTNLLGSPTFKELDNGRFKCVQTGHELLAKDRDLYSQSKRCRLGLIDYALSRNKPPLNVFTPDSSSRSKLICKLTGYTINKSEEHLWKHINGKRFLNKLEEMETLNLQPDDMAEELRKNEAEKQSENGDDDAKKKEKNRKKKKNKKKDKSVEEIISEVRDHRSGDDTESEDVDFWMPDAGERWDFDDGGDRWGSSSDSEHEHGHNDGDCDDHEKGNDINDVVVEDDGEESREISVRTKRMSIEIGGPSSFASRKKPKKEHTAC